MPSRIKSLRISTRLMLINAAILISVLLLTSTLTVVGLYFSVYHQADIEMQRSIDKTLSVISEAENMSPEEFPPPLSNAQKEAILIENPDWTPPPKFTSQIFRKGAILPGVVLRIEDKDGRIVFDNASHYPSMDEIEENSLSTLPVWANQSMNVATLDNFHMYYKNIDVTWHDEPYTLHFIRMITAERYFFKSLTRGLILTNSLGILLALIACYVVSRKTLSPIRTITKTAQEIEVSDLSRRIDVPPANDELKTLVITFNHMLDRLELGFEQQKRFVSDASHELRTPVTVILGYSDMLSRWGREDPETLDEGIAAIHSEAENMKGLIERLLFLARADLKRQVLSKEQIPMDELIDDIYKKAALVATNQEMTLTANDHAMIYGDKVTIRQMLRIFIENAMKYTPAGGHIELSSTKENGMLHVAIKDDGIGIAPEHHKKIFERFYRVDTSRTKNERDANEKSGEGVSGTGLGLSIARWIADAHDITIKLDSALGKGTTIHLYIPTFKS